METTHSEAETRLVHNIQPSSCPGRWRQPTWRQQQDCSTIYNYPLAPKMVTIHSEVATRLLYNIHLSIHMPCRWDFPHSEVATRLLRCWDFPHLKKSLYVLLLGFSHSEMATQTCPLVFLDHPKGIKTLCCGISLLGVLQGFLPLRAPIWCSTTEIFPTRNTNTSLQALFVWTHGQMNTSIHSILQWNFSHSGDSSNVGVDT